VLEKRHPDIAMNKRRIDNLLFIFCHLDLFTMSNFQVSWDSDGQPNGLRYPRVGGTRQRHFAGTNLKPRNLPENAATPTRRVHAVLGALVLSVTP